MAKRKLSVAVKNFNRKMNSLSVEEIAKLNDVEQLVLELMKEHGVSNFRFKFGYGWRYLGKCNSSKIIIQYEYALCADINSIKNTILHEITHAIVGVDKGHREEWQAKAQDLGVVLNRKYYK